jgi:alpha-mannosidase
MKTMHLVCNAHLDPVWQWPWEEGAAAAISTFRVAADLCDSFDGFVFNHNEAILYRWVEEYEPALFARIQRLVAAGRWHIMGGWYLQPDCNMPSGESFVRQILLGKVYFREKFAVEPTTAINFDSFGHTRGLVQILAKSGYDSYLFCRPDRDVLPLPANDFTWAGYDGSTITAHRSIEFYNSALGHADDKIRRWLDKCRDHPVALCLWGIGNHGGGHSRIGHVQALMEETAASFTQRGKLWLDSSTPRQRPAHRVP